MRRAVVHAFDGCTVCTMLSCAHPLPAGAPRPPNRRIAQKGDMATLRWPCICDAGGGAAKLAQMSTSMAHGANSLTRLLMQIVQELKSSHGKTRPASRSGTGKSAKPGFVDRVQERLATPSGLSGVAFYNQGQSTTVDSKKGTPNAAPAAAAAAHEVEIAASASELTAAAKKPVRLRPLLLRPGDNSTTWCLAQR